MYVHININILAGDKWIILIISKVLRIWHFGVSGYMLETACNHPETPGCTVGWCQRCMWPLVTTLTPLVPVEDLTPNFFSTCDFISVTPRRLKKTHCCSWGRQLVLVSVDSRMFPLCQHLGTFKWRKQRTQSPKKVWGRRHTPPLTLCRRRHVGV